MRIEKWTLKVLVRMRQWEVLTCHNALTKNEIIVETTPGLPDLERPTRW